MNTHLFLNRAEQRDHRLLHCQIGPVHREGGCVTHPVPRPTVEGRLQHRLLIIRGVQEPTAGESLQASYHPVGSPVGDGTYHEDICPDVTGNTPTAGAPTPPGPK